jgi:hypothetical protein
VAIECETIDDKWDTDTIVKKTLSNAVISTKVVKRLSASPQITKLVFYSM